MTANDHRATVRRLFDEGRQPRAITSDALDRSISVIVSGNRPRAHDGSPDRVCAPHHLVCDAASFADVPPRSCVRLYTRMTTTTITNDPTRHDSIRPLLVDVAQAAEILAISRSSVYRLIWNEQLTPVRIGRSVRFSIAQLEQFVADRIAESE